MSHANAAHDLLQTAEQFLVPLRMGEGFTKERFDQLCDSLIACGKEWAQSESIPKAAANVLVDLFPVIESCSHLPFYGADEGQRIREAADTIAELVRNCVSSESAALSAD